MIYGNDKALHTELNVLLKPYNIFCLAILYALPIVNVMRVYSPIKRQVASAK